MAARSRRSEAAFAQTKRIVIVDDHPLVRKGLAELIDAEPDLEICGEAGTIPEALSVIREQEPDLAVIDLSLKDGNGLDLIKSVKEDFPDVRTLVTSMHDETLFAERSLRAGAMGYIGKEEATDRIVRAIRDVLDGKIHLSDRMSDRLLYKIVQGDESQSSPVENLSDRELEVLQLIGQGLTTREIAEQLTLSVKTIDTYRENLKTKLNLESGNELIRYAVAWTLQESRGEATSAGESEE